MNRELYKSNRVQFDLCEIFVHGKVVSLHVALSSKSKMDQSLKLNTVLEQLL